MTPVVGTLTVDTLLQLEGLGAEPVLFVVGWLLLGWLLLRANSQEPGRADVEVVDVHHAHRADRQRGSGLKIALLIISIYILLRYWRNR